MLEIRTVIADTERIVERLSHLDEFLGEIVDIGIQSTHDIIAEVFEGEGEVPRIGKRRWAPLKPRTIEIRLSLGFGEGPILVRTGSLKAAMLDESNSMHVVQRIRVGPCHYMGKVGTTDVRFEWHQTGDDPSQPTGIITPRPIWPLGEQERRFVDSVTDTIERALVDWMVHGRIHD